MMAKTPRSSLRVVAPILFAVALVSVYMLPWLQARDGPGLPPGGFTELATDTTTRAVPTAGDLAGLLPSRGTFTFPAPYNTTGIRLTNSSDCTGDQDCVNYVGYSYWRNMNNSAGSNYLYAMVVLARPRGGVGPSIFRYNKTTGETLNLGALFPPEDFRSESTGEGWYFSATQPTTLYVPRDSQLQRVDILTHVTSVVFDITSQFGADKSIIQLHSSNDDRVHSFTLRPAAGGNPLGCGVYREDTSQFSFYPTTGNFDECQVDKSGQWLLIKDDADNGVNGEDNRIIDLATGAQTVLLDADGAGGHSDNGFGVMVAADNHNDTPNALRLWTFGPPPLASGPIVYQDPAWASWSMHHVSFANARSAPLGQQYACGSGASRVNGPRNNEVVCVRLDGSLTTLVVAPVMTDLDTAGGGSGDYAKEPKGNLDPTGEFFMWTSNMMGGRLDAFIARVPAQLLVTPPSDITAPTVAVTAPAQDATVFGTVPLSATATDTVGVVGVQFLLDGATLGAELTVPAYTWNWNTTTTTDGVHALRAVARDAAGNTTMSAPISVTVNNTPAPPAISGVQAVGTTPSTALVTWTTNQLASGQVEYGLTTTYGNSTTLDPALTASHWQVLSGLTQNTIYHVRVTSTNAQSQTTTSGDFTFTTIGPAAISGVGASGITASEAVLSWTTDLAASTQAEYGLTTAFGSTTTLDPAATTSHQQTITGLAAGTTYHYRALAVTGPGVPSASGDFTFTTENTNPGLAPGGILESATSTTTRALLTPSTLAALLPLRGQFTFPAPYNTTGVRLTNRFDCSEWYDCVNTPNGGSWRNMNNSAGSNFLYVVLGMDHSNGGAGPTLFRYNKTTGETVNLGGLFDGNDDRRWGSLDGWYFSPTLPTKFYIGLDTELQRFDVLTHTTDVVFDIASQFGDDKEIYHAQSSNDDRVHSFTLRLINNYQPLGCGVYREDTHQFSYYPAVGDLHECQIDKSGQWLLIKEDRDSLGGEDNRIVNVYTGAETVLLEAAGAAGSSDNGYGGMVAVDGTAADPGAIRTWAFGPLTAGPVVYHSLNGFPASFTQISFANARSAALDQQFACGGVATRGNGPRANEIACVRLDGSKTTLTIAPTMTDLDALGGGPDDDLIKQPFGNLDPTGQYFLWTTNLLGDRIDAFLVRVPYQTLVTPPSDTTGPAVSMSAPADAATVSGTMLVSAAATDNVGVAGVQFQLDGATLGAEDTTSPFQLSWDTTTAADGVHVLTATARDAAGNYTLSLPIAVTVLNTPAAPVISGVSASAITERLATVRWTTNQLADSVIEYGPTTAYGSVSLLDAALVAAHMQTLDGLTPGTTYHYRVTSKNAQNVSATSADFTFTSQSAAVITAVGVSAITGTSATVSWTTDLPSNSMVEFGPTTDYGDATNTDDSFVTSHVQGLYTLEPGTTYHFRVYSVTPESVMSVSADFTFTTLGMVFNNVGGASVTNTSAQITWNTTPSGNSQVEYGLTTAYGSTTTIDPNYVFAHSQTITGLTAGSLYHFRVKSTSAAALAGTSGDFTFITSGGVPAVISAVAATSLTPTSAAIGWTTDQAASSQVEYGLTTAYGTTTTLDPTLVTAHGQALTGLTAGTLYHYRVKSTTVISLPATSADFTFSTVGVPAIFAVAATSITGTSVTIGWTTDQPSSTQVEYGLTTAYGNLTTLTPALVTTHSKAFGSLTAATTYHYRVISTNTFSQTGTSGDFTFATASGPTISAVAATSLTGTSATIGWTTDQVASSQVEYGLTTTYGSTTTLDSTLVTTHGQNLTGLTIGTLYHYRVTSTNALALASTSADFTFTTIAPPVISGVAASSISGTAASIDWTTDQAANSQVEYGLTTAYGSVTTVDATLVTTHSQPLTGLTIGTVYHYRVKSTNSVSLLTTSGDFTVTTVAAPVISGVTVSGITDTAATIGWTTDQTASSRVEYGPTTAYGSLTTVDPTLVTSHTQPIAGLTAGTTYHYRVISTNSAAVTATSGDFSFITGPTISAVAASSLTGTAATIGWTTDLASSSQVDYGTTTAYGSTTTLDATLVTTHSQNLTGLTIGTLYHYRVRSTNIGGATSTSGDVTFTTIAAPVISAVAASALTGTAATIGWTTDQTASSLVEYGLTTAYGSTTTLDATLVTTHSQNLTGLVTGTLYHYRVASTNSVALTTTSADVTFTTVAPPVVSAVAASAITGTAATIGWTTDQTANSQVEYGLTTAYGSTTTVDATLVTTHSQNLTGLATGTLYHYRVTSTNGVALTTTSADVTFTTIAAPVISAVAASAITGTTATIGWTTDQTADSQVEYGLTTAYGSTTTLDATLVTSHSQNLAGLATGTLYHYRVKSTSGVSLLSTSADVTFTTVAAPAISAVAATAITGTSATIGWTTDQAASSQVEYGLTTAYGSTTTLDATLVTTHGQSLAGLTVGTLYHYRVTSTNGVALTTTSGDVTFSTVAAPVISGLAASVLTGTTATIGWTTDQASDSQVEYGLTTAYGATTTLNPSMVTTHGEGLTGLTVGTLYHYRVASKNSLGMLATSLDVTFTTVAPPVVSAVAATSLTGTSATIGWTTNQTASSQVEYGLTTAYGATTTLDATLVTTHGQNLTGLTIATLYHYRVTSTNGVGLTTTSADFTFTTIGPPVISAVAASALTGTTATIGWTTDQTADSQVEYGLTTAYGATTTVNATLVTSHSQNLTGLSTGTLYHYRVKSTNGVGLPSTSGDVTFTTVGPPVISAVAASALTGTTATIGWTTDQTAGAQVEYGLTTGYGSTTTLDATLVTTHSQGLTGLTIGTLYHYRVTSTNGVALTTTSADFTFTTIAPPVVSAVAASALTGTTATIGWTTDQTASSQVEYGLTTGYGSTTTLDATLVTTHSQNLAGLTVGTLYHYRVTSTNGVGLTTSSADATFTTVAPPVISAVAVSALTGTSATIAWATDQATTSRVEYGTTTAYGSVTTLDATLVTSHSQGLAALAPGTLYHYRVISTNAVALTQTSVDDTFTTVALPVISGVTASALTGTTATIGWTTDQTASSQVEYGPTTAYGSLTTLDATLVTSHSQGLAGLSVGTLYHYRVISTNNVALTATSADATFTTVAAPVISGIGATGITGSAATIGWTTDQAASSQVEYGTTTSYGSFTTLDATLVTTHSQNLAGLSAGTLYHYRVVSTNSVGVTATSADTTFTTVAPPVIGGVASSAVTGTSATIDWTTDQASDTQVEYGLTTAYGSTVTLDPALVTTHSQSFGGLTMGTLYHYRVKSRNSFTLLATSGDFTFTTIAPPVITAVAATSITGTGAAIGWTTDQAATSQVEYGLTTAYGSSTTLGATLILSHSQALTGLANGTLYHYRVKSMNSLNLLATSADFTFTTVAVPVISAVASSAITGTTATITWTTDQTTDSLVEYGPTTAYGSTTTLDATLVTAHSQGLAGLATGTLYHYRVKSTNSVGLLATSGDGTFTTVAPPVISAVASSAITGTTATISWTTDQTTSSQVEYGPTTAYGSTTTLDPAMVTAHGQNLTGLATGTLYHYRVKSANSVNLTTTSEDFTFTTVAPPAVSAVAASAITGSAATVGWTTDQTATSQVEYGLTTAYGSTTTFDGTLVTAHSQGLAGLTNGTLYHYRVTSTNSVNLTTTSADFTFTTVAAPVISAVATTSVTGTSVTIGWTTDQTADSQVEYGLTTAYGSTTTLDASLVTTHSQAFGSLTVGTTYHYRVKSRNSFTLLATSGDFTFTTVAAPVISGVAASSLTGTGATIGWTTNQSATSQVEYGLTTAYGNQTTLGATLTTVHSQALTGLANGTLYHYRVKSMNSLNLLTTSADFTFTTVAPPVISAVAASALTGTTATIGWTTDQTADSQVEYGLTTAYGSTTTLDATLVTSHSQGLASLATGTLYHYRVRSTNGVSLLTTSGDFTFTTVAPPVISAVAASAITGTTATIGWTTDQNASSQVDYGLTTAYGSTTTLDPTLVTSHSQNLAGLATGTLYHYRVKSTNSVGLTTMSGDVTLTTVAPTVISGVAASSITGTSATIGWTTDQTADSQVEFGPTTAYGSTTGVNATLVTTHSQGLAGLANGSLYHYRVKSTNGVGLTTTSGDFTFTTAAPPVISGVSTSSITGTSATVLWTTDQTASSQVEYGLTTGYGSTTTLDPTLVTSHSQGFTGLLTGTTYHYRVKSTNGVGLLTASGDFTFATVAVPVVSGVVVSGVTDTAATISWNTDQSTDTQVEYGPTSAYGTTTTLNGTLVTAHSQNLSGLTAGTIYHYRVRSTNLASLVGTSPDATFTTVAAPVISGVAATALTGTSATIGWTTDQPADSQVDYGLTTAYGSSTTLNATLVTTHSQSFTGLTVGTPYHYRVKSKNSLGMLTTSPDLLFTTVAPPVVSAVAASALTGSTATIGWTTDQLADSQVEYGLTTAYGSLTTLNGSLVTAHSQGLTGLTPATTYHYRVRSTNAVALSTTSIDFTFTTVAPPVVSAVAASAITGTAATIGWTTDQAASSQVEYGLTTAYGSTTTLDATLVTTHSQNLTGLANGTTYHYRVKSTNSVSLLTTSGDFTFTTVAPPVINLADAIAITGTTATIEWTSDQASTSQVEYGLTTAYGSSTTIDATLVTAHAQGLTGLATGTLYHYRVKSTNSVGLTTTSWDYTFTTVATPVISAVAASAITGTGATINWTTDQAADSQVDYGPTTAYGSTTSLNASLVTSHSQSLTGLANGTLYHYRVRSTNGVALTATSGDVTFTTVAAPVVSAVAASGITGTSVTIGWTTDQAASSLVEYGLTTAYGSTTALDATLVTTHSQSFIFLTPGTLYHYRVISANSVGLTTTSGDFTFTTVAPPVVSGIAATTLTGTSATIVWTTNQQADSQVEYGLTTAYGAFTTLDATLVTSHSQGLTGLSIGTLYHYRVLSRNALDLVTTSADQTFTTVAPPVVSAVAASAVTGSTATIGWTTDQSATSQVEYGLTSFYGSFTALDSTLVTTHSRNLAGLANGTTYHYHVKSTNGVGLTTTSGDFTLTTVATPVVSGIATSAITGTGATIGWTTDQAATSRVDYGLTTAYGSTTTLDASLVTTHSQNLTGLANGTTYHYRVISANNVALTATSGDQSFTTVAPPVVNSLVVSGITGTAATIGWTTDQTATSQVEYGLTTAYGSTTTLDATLVTTHSQNLTGLANGTTYHYRVISANSVGLTVTSGDNTFATVAVPVISAVAASGLTGTAATIGWTTDQAASSQVEYGLTTAYGAFTTLDATLVTAHGQAIGGLAIGTLYHYRVKSTNSVGLTATSADQTFTTVAPPVLSNIVASGITGTSATITWTTDQPADSQVEYGLTTAMGSFTTLDGNFVTSHSQIITGLAIGTLYHYRVISTNSVGLTTMSEDPVFTTVAMPVISSLAASAVTGTSATIGWTTDQATSSRVEYGLTTAYGSLTTIDPTLVTTHGVNLTGLANGTLYHYRVISTDSVNLTATSGDATFTTVAVPVISSVASSAVTGSTATVTWTTDQATSSRVEYGPTTAYGAFTTLDATLVTNHSQGLGGLTPGTPYHYRVISTNGVSLTATSGDSTFTTVAVPVISGVASSAITGTAATIAWTTDQNTNSEVEYGLTTAYGSFTTIDPTPVTSHSQNLTGLANGTLYHYRVISTNGVSLTATSGDVTFTTIGVPVISGVAASAITGTAATIGWTTDQNTSAEVEYGLTTAYGSFTTLDPTPATSHSQNLTGLANGTLYHYRVLSTNGVSLTATSGDVTFTTVAVPVVSAVAASAITGTSATISWTTDQAASSRVEYGPTTAYGSFTTLDATLVTTHGQNLTGLANGTVYHYRVISTNSVSLTATSGDVTFTTVAVPVISSVAASAITGTAATIGWTTDQATSSEVEYGLTTAYGSLTTINPALATGHSENLTGLANGTLYHYRVISTNSVSLTATSGDFTFTTVALPVISGVASSAITSTTATIDWTTDQATSSRVEYGLTTAYGALTTLNPALVTAHSEGLTGLTTSSTYHYRVISTNSVGLTATSPDFTFVAVPVISGIGASAITGTAATIGWTTDQATSAQVEYGLTSAYGSFTTLDATLVASHSQNLTGLANGTLYHYRVISANSVNLTATSGDNTFTTVAVPVISGVASSAVTGTSATLDWTTDQTTSSQVEYGLTTAYGSFTTLDATLVTSHSQSLGGLANGTTYHYRVISTNSVNLTATSGDVTFTTVAVPVISGVASSAVTGSTATIGWTTDQATSSEVEYGLTTFYGSLTTLDANLLTSHSQNLTGLANGTLYHYRVISTNSVNLTATSGDFTFTTVAVPVVSAVAPSAITGTTATIGWTTDQAADSQVDYGLTTAYGSTTSLNASLVTSHSQGLTGLTPGTLYHYRVRSTNSVTLTATSGDSTFTTVALPVVSAVAVSSITGTAATVTWTTDQAADSQIEYGTTTAYGSTTTLNASLVTSHNQGLTGLAPGTLYHYRVTSTNSVALSTTSADGTFTTVAVPVISAVSASSITPTSATIGWTTDQSTDSQVEYGTTTGYGSFTTLDGTLVTGHSQAFAGLAPGTLYHYRVLSTNSVALTATSSDQTFTTIGPPAISAVAASAITGSTATIGWTTDQASDSQIEYGLTSAYGSSTVLDASFTTSHLQSLSGLTPGATYHYRVTSQNLYSLTGASGDFTLTTVAPPVVSDVASSALTGTAVTITWTTDQAASSRVEYGPTTGYGSFTTLDATLVTSHGQGLSGLSIGTVYHYRVISTNSVALTTMSGDATFTTVAAPVVSGVNPSAFTGTTATVSWTTDQTASSRVEYGPTTSYGSFTTLDATLVTSHSQGLTGLTIGTLYHYRAISTNSVGLTTTSPDWTFTTVALPVVSAVAATGITATTATIGWTTDQASSSQVEYGLTTAYGTLTSVNPALVTSHSEGLTGLTTSQTYHYRVICTNSVGLTTTSPDFTFVAVPVISGIAVSAVTGTAAIIGWTTDQATSSQIEYGPTSAYGATSTLDPTLVTTHSQNLAGLTPGTLYHYRVISTNSALLTATSADGTFTTVAVPVISAVASSAITGSAATITWTTDQAATSRVDYGVTSTYGSSTTLDATLVTSHGQNLGGLANGTTYHYRVASTNSVGLTVLSGDATFDTVAPPAVSGVASSALTGTAATISWTTDQTASSRVEYGLTTGYGSFTTLDATLVTSHSQGLSGLSIGTVYHYRVISTNGFALTTTSGDATFTTVALPVISALAPSTITGVGAAIDWTTDQTASSQVQYGLTTGYGSTTTLDAALVTSHSQNVSGLANGTLYHYRVTSTNGVGLTTTSGDGTFTTVAPPVISAVASSAVTGVAATITWTTNQTADSQVQYGLTTTYGSTTTLDATLVTSHSQNLSGLANGTLYHYRVKSTNSVGLLTTSADSTFTTVAVPVISAVSSNTLTGTSATVVWTTNQTADSRVEYGLTTSYGSFTTLNGSMVTSHSEGLSGLANGTLYHYRVISTNSVVLTATSGDFTFTTVAPPVISAVATSALTGVSATVTWTTNQTASSQVQYGPTTTYGSLTTLDATLVTSHSQGLSGLTPGTLYHYRVVSTNSVSLTTTSSDATFTTVNFPVLSAEAAGSLTNTSATITWTSDQTANSQVEYGTTTAYGSSTTLNGTLVTSHSQNLTSLTAGTTYHYRVKSTNGVGLQTVSGDFSFMTNGAAPVIWINKINVTATGNSLQKTSGCDGCSDAGATSQQTIQGDGYVELTASETTSDRWIGLSNTSLDTGGGEILFALRFTQFGVEIRENNAYRTDVPYTAGDIFRVQMTGGQITYLKNGVVIYTSGVTATDPLLVDTSLWTANATLNNVVIRGGS